MRIRNSSSNCSVVQRLAAWHPLRNSHTITGLLAAICMFTGAAGAQTRTTIPDSAIQLNRAGKWREAFDLAARNVNAASVTRQQSCILAVSGAYAAIRLSLRPSADSALASARTICAGMDASIDRELSEYEAELARMKNPASLPPIEAVVIHPIHSTVFLCNEHRQPSMELGDRWASDCMVAHVENLPDGSRKPMALFRGDGTRNEDWYGWGATLLAPFDGVVTSVTRNNQENRVGVLAQQQSTAIVFMRSDSVMVVYAHLGSVTVEPGTRVRAGQPVGTVGNNGRSYNPHTHVGAWKGTTPLQIRFDLRIPGG